MHLYVTKQTTQSKQWAEDLEREVDHNWLPPRAMEKPLIARDEGAPKLLVRKGCNRE